ncbi:MAG TPA: HAD hydrolase family protein [Methylomirabilota bacterium]|nr:HAD hydrolase family protein [Methylomirabilota bacterium]
MIPFKALACDVDGTLAVEDRVEPEVKGSLEQARRMGVRLILVTGRTFFELTRVCDCLELFDAVVAENGSVIYHPGSAMIRDLGPAVPARLLAELDRRGTYYQAGRVIVSTARADEMAVREALSTAGVSRDLITNRAALMLLPSGLSKGSGVEQVLRFLELSPHDVLARGDAENDLALFGAPGLGTLRRVCDRSGGRDYRVLSRLPGASWTDVREPSDVDYALESMQHNPSASAILDLSMLPHGKKLALVDRAIRRIREISTWIQSSLRAVNSCSGARTGERWPRPTACSPSVRWPAPCPATSSRTTPAEGTSPAGSATCSGTRSWRARSARRRSASSAGSLRISGR